MNGDNLLAFKITWDKILNSSELNNRYVPTVSVSFMVKNEDIHGYYLYATISKNHYKIEAQKNGTYGHLYPKVLVSEGLSKSLAISKRKVRSIFKQLCSVYQK